MKKDRLVAFTDAVLAIIMTVLVLELKKPEEISIAGFWALRQNFFAYWLSFFWLGSVWISMHFIWEDVKWVSRPVLWWSIIFLFCASFMPYATGIVSNSFGNATAQAFYGLVMIATSCCNWILHKIAEKPNAGNAAFLKKARDYRSILLPDLLIKVTGLILAVTVYPQSMVYSVLLAAIYMQCAKIVYHVRKKKTV